MAEMLGKMLAVRRPTCRQVLLVLALVALGLLLAGCTAEQGVPSPRLTIGLEDTQQPEGMSSAMQILLLLTVLSLAPSLLIMVTSFTRIIIVLALLRQALGLVQIPPTQVLVGLALFLSLFVMAPVLDDVNKDAFQPYSQGTISQEEAVNRGLVPLRDFMLKQTNEKDIALFLSMGKFDQPDGPEDVPTHVLVPAFVLSEIKTAFQMGFVLFIPCLVIDMVVASVLMSMGMMMLPPMMISLPFKLLLFVLVDGWTLVVQSLVTSFS
ncbi:MAG: flagellar type III secretion system pore protein FliP [Chloroflexota bacterium]